MIVFSDWKISIEAKEIARQYDNLSRTLLITGEIPQGWTWELLVGVGDNFDIIALSPMSDGIGAVLTESMLALSGHYTVQLRGRQGDMVRHTNQIRLYVGPSMSGSARWPQVPSEFAQAEQKIREISEHPPVPGTKGNWLIWNPDIDQYEESELPLPEGSLYNIGNGLKLEEESNTLSVNTAESVQQGNTLPVTSAAVYAAVGDIESLLESI